MTSPTHDLAIARAERELHRAIAGRCEAADQRARSLEAALTMAQGSAVACADELRAIRDLVAPGNPQGTVVDAVRARLDAVENAQAFGIRERDAAIARAEKAESDLSELTAARDRLLAREHEDGRLHAQLRAELAELRARTALTVEAFTEAYIKTKHGGKAWPGEEADRRGLTAQFRATFAALGPVTLPSPDRAEELAATLVGTARASMTDVPIAWSCDFADGNENARRALTNVVRTALAKLSPDPAPAFDTAFLRRVMVATKHGPNGKGGPGPCDAACVKCEAELMAKAAPAREVAPTRVLVHADGGACHGSRVVDGRCVGCGLAPDMQSTSLWLDADARPVQCEPAKVVAPTLVAVSDEELAVAFYSEPERPALRECIDAADLAGIRAVRAKLGAAEVTEERLREAIREERHVSSFVAEDTAKGVLARLRATAAKGG